MSATPEEPVTSPVVVIYGDFNCPFSAAASARAERVEPGLLLRPARRVNTSAAIAAYAGTTPEHRRELRRAIFVAYWQRDADIADGDTLAALGASGVDTDTAAAWRRSWLSLPQPIVPAMVLSDGYVSRGLGVLSCLGDALGGYPDRLRGR